MLKEISTQKKVILMNDLFINQLKTKTYFTSTLFDLPFTRKT